MTSPADAQTLADIGVYQRVIAAGFTRPVGADSNNMGAVYATAILIEHPGTDLAGLLAQWKSANGNGSKLSGWRPGLGPGSGDAVWLRAMTAVTQAEVVGLGGDIATGTAAGVGQGLGAIPEVLQAGEQGAVAAAQGALGPFAGVAAFLSNLSNPQFLLRVVTVVGGGFLVLMGAWLAVEHSGTGAAMTRAVGKMVAV